jgi:hypothetical protein
MDGDGPARDDCTESGRSALHTYLDYHKYDTYGVFPSDISNCFEVQIFET